MKKPNRAKIRALALRHRRDQNAAGAAYGRRLRRLVTTMRANDVAALTSAWPALDAEAATPLNAVEELRARGAKIFDAQAATLAKQQALVAQKIGYRWVDQDAREAFGINVGDVRKGNRTTARNMKQAIEDNVSLIKSIPEKHYDRVEKIVTSALDAGTRPEDIAADILECGDITEGRAAFIARDQMAKATSAFNEERLASIGVESYVWETSDDERVRPSHAALQGQVFTFDDPPDTSVEGQDPAFNNPGFDYNCRCVAIPNFDEIAPDE